MTVFLHHYPASLFSEKVRLMLGYLGVDWHSVVIPNIMPRPLLMPLSGGYRKTPCLQIGANVFCDSAAIAHGLVRHTKDETLFAPGFVAHRVAEWADTQLFRVTVALNFRPEAVAAMMGQLDPSAVAAFAKDRAELAKGGSLQTVSPRAAEAYLTSYLRQLDASLDRPFLFGDTPSIADFSLYHNLWFLQQNATNAPLLEPFATVGAWIERMAAFGHGKVTESTGEEALAHARDTEPHAPSLDAALPAGISLGDRVAVTPVDYGLVPVAGELVACSAEEVVIARETPETGRVMTHFPAPGFVVEPA